MSLKMIQEYIALYNERKDHEEKVKELKEKMTAMKPVLTEWFALEGLQNMKTKDGTAFLQTTMVASLVKESDGSAEAAHAALRAAGLDYLVKEGVNSKSLNAYVNERHKQDEEIPQGLQPFLRIHELYDIKVRS